MATRIYLPSSGTNPMSNNATVGTWTETTGFDLLGASTSKTSTAMTNKTQARTASGANSTWLDRMYIAGPLSAQTFGISAVKGTIRALESAANDNVDAMRLLIRVVAPNGTTFRGTIYGPTNSTVAEFNTVLRAKRLATGGATSSVTITEGDYLVIEIGATTTVAGTSISTSINYGDNSATDLGDNETDTAANNPFVEFAANMKFLGDQQGQAQAYIKSTYRGLGQAQGSIKTYYTQVGQAQAQIKPTYWGLGQAQAKLNAFNINGLGQTQVNILPRTGVGQAQAYIIIPVYTFSDTFGTTVSNGWGAADTAGVNWLVTEYVNSNTMYSKNGLVGTIANTSNTSSGNQIFTREGFTGAFEASLTLAVNQVAAVNTPDLNVITNQSVFFITGRGNDYILDKYGIGIGISVYRNNSGLIRFGFGTVNDFSLNLAINNLPYTLGIPLEVNFKVWGGLNPTGYTNTQVINVEYTVSGYTFVAQFSRNSNNNQTERRQAYPGPLAIYTLAQNVSTQTWTIDNLIVQPFSPKLFGQAQAQIGGFQYGQAQAQIKQTYSVSGQTQAKLNAFNINASSNSTALISPVYTVPFTDNFNRTVGAGSLGTASFGDVWVSQGGTGAGNISVDGAKLSFGPSRQSPNGWDLRQTSTGSAYEVSYKFTAQRPTVSSTNIDFRSHKLVGIGSPFHAINLRIDSSGNITIYYTARSSTIVAASIDNAEYTFKAHLLPVSGSATIVRVKVWLSTDVEPGWQVEQEQTTQTLKIGYPSIYLFIDDYLVDRLLTIDDLSVKSAYLAYSGQAQAQIKQTYSVSGQTQAQIKTTYFALGQAQGQIKITYFALGQAQTSMVKFAKQNINGQAQVYISETYAKDTFTRTLSSDWGTADIGGTYTKGGTFADFAVDGSVGTHTLSAANATRTAYLLSVVKQDVDITVRFKTDKLAVAGKIYAMLMARQSTNNTYYRIPISIATDQTIDFTAYSSDAGTEVLINGTITQVPRETHAINTWFNVRAQVRGINPTTIRAKVWQEGTSEPAGWDYTETDSTASLQVAAGVGLRSYLQTGASNAPVVVSYDDFFAKLPVDRVFGQAQARIVYNQSNSAQANAVIDTGQYIGLDTFTRTVSNGLGTADIGGDWTVTNSASISTDGSSAVNLGSSTKLNSVTSKNQYYARVRVSFASVTSESANLYVIYPTTLSRITGVTLDVTSGSGNLNTIITGSGQLVSVGSITINTWYWLAVHINKQNIYKPHIRVKMWEDGTSEPGWLLERLVTTISGRELFLFGPPGFAANTTDTIKFDDFNAFPAGWTESGQAQATIKQTYTTTGQAQAQIKQTYFGLGQAQAQIKQTYFALGQAQATIQLGLVTYSALGQAQARIKQTYSALGQAQAQIKTTYRGLGQAQARIKQTYSASGQAQALIISGTNVSGQAQGHIYTQNYSSGQAQGYISVTGFGFGQAQFLIKSTYFGSGQSQAQIKQTYYGLGQAQATIRGNAFGQTQAQIKQVYYGLGQAQAGIKTNYAAVAQTQADIKQTYNTAGQAQSAIRQIYISMGQAQTWIKTTYVGIGQAQGQIKQVYYGLGQAMATIQGNAWGQAQTWIEQTYNQVGQAQAQIKNTYIAMAQAQTWIEQTYNAVAQTQADIKQVYIVTGQAQVQVKQTYTVVGQAQGYVKVTGNNVMGQANAHILQFYTQVAQAQAKLNVYGFNVSGQAQANIRFLGNAVSGQSQARVYAFGYSQHGQAQASIKSVYSGLGQAQTNIKAVGYGSGQSQASILSVYYGSGQAQSDIKATNNGLGQANVYVILLGRNQFGQAHADIKQTYFALGQAQAHILRTENNSGQTNADIKTTYTVTGQAQANIKQIYSVTGQASAIIRDTYRAVAQVQSKINAYGVNQVAQAQAHIKVLGNNVTGQSQAKVNAFDINSSGQAQGSIKSTVNAFGQAQGTIKTTYNQFGQAQGSIEQTYVVVGQAYALIRNTYYIVAQAQASIYAYGVTQTGQAQTNIRFNGNAVYGQTQAKINAFGVNSSGQAQTWIETTTNSHGQAQTDIKQTYFVHGQTNALIVVINSASGQAQSDIKSTYSAHGQAQASIRNTYVATGLAQALIRNTHHNIGQAQTYILLFKQGTGQAQGAISTTDTRSGQTQTIILQAYNISGNAQSHIRVRLNLSGQVQVRIKQRYNSAGQSAVLIVYDRLGTGQAQAVIFRHEAFGQAQGFIKTVHTLKNITVSDDRIVNCVLDDDLIKIRVEVEDTESTVIETIDDTITITLSDERVFNLIVSDEAF